jgi:AraC-like DNA-binding protein/small neutral amino acid transporter SnatA (MarC family)
MDIRLNIYAIVLLFAFMQGVFYIFLFIKRGIEEERKSDFWMAALIATLCIFNLSWMLGFMGIHILGQELWFFPQDIGLVIGPIIFYYLKTQINIDFQFTRQDFKHFIPYCIYFIYHLSIFLMGKNVVGWWDSVFHSPFHIGDITGYAELISSSIYVVASWRLYQKYLVWLPIERSDTEGVRFDWYRHFLWAIVLAVASALVFFILGFWVKLSYWDIWIQRVIVAAVIYYISFAGYMQTQPRHLVFDEKKSGNEPSTDLADVEKDVEKDVAIESKTESKIDVQELEKWKSKIENIMQKDKLFLNSELTLSELSDKLNSHNSLISNVINTAFQKNFNDFVNEFRVNIFKEKINDPKLKHLTLLAIAFDCGFNSKSTFNRAVKKATGQMPSDFLP